MVDACGISGFNDLMNGVIIPLSALSVATTMSIIAVSYMLSQVLSNPKLSLWAKTEAVQVTLSLFTVVLLIGVMNGFCSIKMDTVAPLFGLTADSIDIYTAAQHYLVDAGYYSLRATAVIRYHLEAYNILAALSVFECEFGGIGCLFGYSGTSLQPLGGYGAEQAALNFFFNSSIMSTLTALNFLFILQFVYKGFVLLFLPLGVFMRSMPYLRGFGGLMIAVALSFLIVYPLLLSIFYLMEPVLVDKPNYQPQDFSAFYDEGVFDEKNGAGQSVEAAVMGAGAVVDSYFPSGQNPIGAMQFGAYAFVAAVLMPTAALLGTIGTIAYVARLYGEEIDLSRIVQMV
ncbi:MAG: hypothetical protein U0R44_03170 [Candidatus Micrarchaeia archaeon]